MFDRLQVRAKLCDFLQAEYVALLAQKGAGLDTLIQAIMNQKPAIAGMKFISIALPRGIQNIQDFTDLFIDELVSAASQVPPEGRLADAVQQIVVNHADRTAEFRLRRVLDNLGRNTTAAYLVIILHGLAEAPEEPLKHLLLLLRHYHDQINSPGTAGEKLRFLVAGGARLWHLCCSKTPDRSPFNIAQRVLINGFSLEELQILSLFENAQDLVRLQTLTNGMPSLVGQVIRGVASLDQLSSFFSPLQDHWNSLSAEIQDLLKQLAQGLESHPSCIPDHGCPQIPELNDSPWGDAFWSGFLRIEANQLIWQSQIHQYFVAQRLSDQSPISSSHKPFLKTMSKSERNQVFISYSQKDRKWLDELKTMLAPLVRKQTVLAWDDSRIEGGQDWRQEIEKALSSAKVAVLLVSPNFLASEFIAERELPQLLKAAKEEGVVILWVPISHSLYTATDIEIYQAMHNPAQPLNSLTKARRQQVLVQICHKIQAAANA